MTQFLVCFVSVRKDNKERYDNMNRLFKFKIYFCKVL